MMSASSASKAEKDLALSTVSSSALALRPRPWAMLRIKAAASWVALDARVSGRSCPPPATGEAAPMLVAGAMAATCAAAVMKVPAEAARAPDGAT